MSFERFFRRILSLLPGEVLGEQEANALAQLNPEKIYVENVRSVLDVSTRRAESICETAVRQGVFARGVEVLCPDGTVVASADSEAHLPTTVFCWVDTGRGFDEIEMPTEHLQKVAFYRLADDATHPYSQTA